MRIDPGVARSWVGLGVIFRELGEGRRAIACFRQAIELQPDFDAAWSQMGESLRRQGAHRASAACHRRALALHPDQPAFLLREALNLTSQDRDEDALPIIERVVGENPTLIEAAWARGVCRRRLGDLAGGWDDYEVRLQRRRQGRLGGGELQTPRWRGEPLQGRTLLVMAERPVSETIWASRYLGAAKAQGARLMVSCSGDLVNFFAGMDGVDMAFDENGTAPDHDVHIPICSLPGLFTPDADSIPAAAYLQPDPTRRHSFARWRGLGQGHIRVGVACPDRGRADGFPAALLLDGLNLPGVQLYMLQRTDRFIRDRNGGISPPGRPVIGLGAQLDDLADMAAFIADLDLVIGVDCPALHLAGALGRPVWALLGAHAHWLWGRHSALSPWYPSMRLHRALRSTGWKDPIDQVVTELMRLADQRAGTEERIGVPHVR